LLSALGGLSSVVFGAGSLLVSFYASVNLELTILEKAFKVRISKITSQTGPLTIKKIKTEDIKALEESFQIENF
jgi:hypothetical protein